MPLQSTIKPGILLIYIFILFTVVQSLDLTIATCNMWNVMFNWEMRIKRIADMVREHDLDVVVFQEVRLSREGMSVGNNDIISSQLKEFRPLLPEYKWSLATSAGKVAKFKDTSYKNEWNFEGLGILSRRQILSSKTIKLKQTNFKDHNKRIALHVKLKIGPRETDIVDVVVVHFSYDPNLQCQNANDVIREIDDSKVEKVIILGDFNAYESSTPPLNLFLRRKNSACPMINSQIVGTFKDAWHSAGRGHSQGLTFSNMPIPGLQSRPDRILVSKSIQVSKADVIGDGHQYWKNYYIPVLFSRAGTVIKTSFEAFTGLRGYSCLQDCGPHGSCRCGVCVTGGDENNCQIPDCSECSSNRFILFITFLIPAIIGCVLMLLAVVRILVVSARFSQRDIQEILGYQCCLFNRQLFKTRVIPRRFRVSFSNCIQLYHLPPVWVVLGTALFLIFLLSVFKICFKDSIDVVYSILPEEHFPSDHKILYSTLNL